MTDELTNAKAKAAFDFATKPLPKPIDMVELATKLAMVPGQVREQLAAQQPKPRGWPRADHYTSTGRTFCQRTEDAPIYVKPFSGQWHEDVNEFWRWASGVAVDVVCDDDAAGYCDEAESACKTADAPGFRQYALVMCDMVKLYEAVGELGDCAIYGDPTNRHTSRVTLTQRDNPGGWPDKIRVTITKDIRQWAKPE